MNKKRLFKGLVLISSIVLSVGLLNGCFNKERKKGGTSKDELLKKTTLEKVDILTDKESLTKLEETFKKDIVVKYESIEEKDGDLVLSGTITNNSSLNVENVSITQFFEANDKLDYMFAMLHEPLESGATKKFTTELLKDTGIKNVDEIKGSLSSMSVYVKDTDGKTMIMNYDYSYDETVWTKEVEVETEKK